METARYGSDALRRNKSSETEVRRRKRYLAQTGYEGVSVVVRRSWDVGVSVCFQESITVVIFTYEVASTKEHRKMQMHWREYVLRQMDQLLVVRKIRLCSWSPKQKHPVTNVPGPLSTLRLSAVPKTLNTSSRETFLEESCGNFRCYYIVIHKA